MFAPITIALFGIAAGLCLLGAHWWLPVALRRDTEPPESYVWGTALGILLPFVAWLAFWWAFGGETILVPTVIAGFLSITGLGGLGTLTAYALDRRHGRHLRSALSAAKQHRVRLILDRAGGDAERTLAELRMLFDGDDWERDGGHGHDWGR